MRINGRVRQACSALVDRLLQDDPTGIELRPMSKFPGVRDLCVDRYRLFRALEKLQCWVPLDGDDDMSSQCMSCGCCVDACPQYKKVIVEREENESEQTFEESRDEFFDRNFIGAAMSQAVLMNSHPNGESLVSKQIEAMIAPGGIQNGGKAGNCQVVCPKEIPLMGFWGRANRAATIHVLKKFFDG